MLKRVAVATVFANGGRVLMLDEPFGALDYVTRHQLHDVLLNLWNADGADKRRTVLFVTHDVDEVSGARRPHHGVSRRRSGR